LGRHRAAFFFCGYSSDRTRGRTAMRLDGEIGAASLQKSKTAHGGSTK
jgi:hypothetical protein